MDLLLLSSWIPKLFFSFPELVFFLIQEFVKNFFVGGTSNCTESLENRSVALRISFVSLVLHLKKVVECIRHENVVYNQVKNSIVN